MTRILSFGQPMGSIMQVAYVVEVLYGRVPEPIDARAAYMDTMIKLGSLVELIEMTPAVEAFFTAIKEPSVNWDGKDPVRTLG